MSEITLPDATEKLARAVEQAEPSLVPEIHAELFPWKNAPIPATATDMAKFIRGGLEPEELVDLWNVLFPEHRSVNFNEETKTIHFNEELAAYAD